MIARLDRLVALAGLGTISASQLPALAETKGLRLTDIAEPLASGRALAPAQVTAHRSLTECLATGAARCSILSTPSPLHSRHVLECLAAGHSVLVEKPLAVSAGELDMLCALPVSDQQRLHTAFHAACGLEIQHFLDWQNGPDRIPGVPAEFFCDFRDPYTAGTPGASLVDPWTDSGINALSVLACVADLTGMMPASAGARWDPRFPQPVSQTVQLASPWLRGTIATSWDAGQNRKTTRLEYPASGHRVILDHTAETVTITRHGEVQHYAACASRHPRLVAHYRGVFADWLRHLQAGTSNFKRSVALHRLHLQAAVLMGEVVVP